MKSSFYEQKELSNFGFKAIGENVLISRFACFYSPETIEIGSNVRIDDFCILSGNIKLHSYIHISAHTILYGRYGIEMEDYTGLSPRCTVFTASDDFSGEFLIGPMVHPSFTKVFTGPVMFKKFSQMGANCVVFPNISIGEGTVIGAMSLVNCSLDPWSIYAGIPVKFKRVRSKNLLKNLL